MAASTSTRRASAFVASSSALPFPTASASALMAGKWTVLLRFADGCDSSVRGPTQNRPGRELYQNSLDMQREVVFRMDRLSTARDVCGTRVGGAGVVRRFDPDGKLVGEIPIPSRNVTCAAFGGDSLDQLFVTSSRQEMTEEQLSAAPVSGGVFVVLAGTRGVCDALFRE